MAELNSRTRSVQFVNESVKPVLGTIINWFTEKIWPTRIMPSCIGFTSYKCGTKLGQLSILSEIYNLVLTHSYYMVIENMWNQAHKYFHYNLRAFSSSWKFTASVFNNFSYSKRSWQDIFIYIIHTLHSTEASCTVWWRNIDNIFIVEEPLL